MADAYVKLAELRPVEVEHGGAWWPGQLEAWRRVDGARRAYVRYNVGTGLTHLAWVTSGTVRER